MTKVDELLAHAKKLKPNDQLRLALMTELTACWHFGKKDVPADRLKDFTTSASDTYFAIIARNVLTDVMKISMETGEDPAAVVLLMCDEYISQISQKKDILNNIRSAILSDFKKD